MDKTLNNIEENIYGFQAYVDDVRRLHTSALEVGQPILAIHAKRALDGLQGIVGFFERVHSAILKEEEPIESPIVKESRPKLTLIKGGTDNVRNSTKQDR